MKIDIYGVSLAYDKNRRPIKGVALRKFNSICSAEKLSDLFDDPYDLKKHVEGGNIYFKTYNYKNSTQYFQVHSTYTLTRYLTEEETAWLMQFTKKKWEEENEKKYGKHPVNEQGDMIEATDEYQRVKFLLSDLI